MSFEAATGLVVRDLDAGRFGQAFPLAKTAMPELRLDDWMGFLGRLSAEAQGGALVVENQRGVMLAFAGFLTRHHLGAGCCLEVDPLFVMDLVGASAVVRILEESLQQRARQRGCQSLHLHLPHRGHEPANDRALATLLDCGLAAESWRLQKRLALPSHPD